MCWYSAEHSGQSLLQAEAGQRLTVRKMHSGRCWVVKDTDLEKSTPAPVCLLDGTQALFRPTEAEQTALQLGPEPQAVFHMRGKSKKDVFEFPDGREIEVDRLPAGLIFDVLLVPGREHLSGVLNAPPVPEQVEEEEPVLARLRRWF